MRVDVTQFNKQKDADDLLNDFDIAMNAAF